MAAPPPIAVDALLGVLLSCLSKKVDKEGHPVVSPFGCPSFSKQEAREIDGRVGDQTASRRRPPQLAVPGQLTLSISRASATQQGGEALQVGPIKSLTASGRDRAEEPGRKILVIMLAEPRVKRFPVTVRQA
ncbi:hypothetical protein CEK62_06665 [Alcanivorax sp. N3-2A]|nr:hypothetical protein CEK62_06665 [Alcanivorax sp. N3-2A]